MKKTAIALAIAALGMTSAQAAQAQTFSWGASAEVSVDAGARSSNSGRRSTSRRSKSRRRYRRPVRPVRVTPTVRSMYPSAGYPGTQVTIRGTNFNRSAKVYISGEWITPTVVRSNRIVFTVPRNARDSRVAVKQSRSRTVRAGRFNVLYRPVKTEHTFRATFKYKSEATLHARRMAKIKRMLRLARHDKALYRWIRNIQRRELNRHNRVVASLRVSYFTLA